MRLIKPSHTIESPWELEAAIHKIEQAGKTCYKTQGRESTGEQRELFVRGLIRSGHHSVLEHASFSVRFVCDRGVSHELVRHRLVGISQESTRYCNYNGSVEFVIPPWVDLPEEDYPECKSYSARNMLPDEIWFFAMMQASMDYNALIKAGWSPQQARAVLPNSLKTELVMTANIREWRHILSLRAVGTAGVPHPQMVELMQPLLDELKRRAPALFDDV